MWPRVSTGAALRSRRMAASASWIASTRSARARPRASSSRVVKNQDGSRPCSRAAIWRSPKRSWVSSTRSAPLRRPPARATSRRSGPARRRGARGGAGARPGRRERRGTSRPAPRRPASPFSTGAAAGRGGSRRARMPTSPLPAPACIPRWHSGGTRIPRPAPSIPAPWPGCARCCPGPPDARRWGTRSGRAAATGGASRQRLQPGQARAEASVLCSSVAAAVEIDKEAGARLLQHAYGAGRRPGRQQGVEQWLAAEAEVAQGLEIRRCEQQAARGSDLAQRPYDGRGGELRPEREGDDGERTLSAWAAAPLAADRAKPRSARGIEGRRRAAPSRPWHIAAPPRRWPSRGPGRRLA